MSASYTRVDHIEHSPHKNFFTDATYKIIPKENHLFKLIVLSSLADNKNVTILLALILIKNLNSETINS